MHILFDLRTIERLPVAHQIDLMSMWDRIIPTLDETIHVTIFVTRDTQITKFKHPSITYVSTGRDCTQEPTKEELAAAVKRHEPTHYLSPDPRLAPPSHVPAFYMILEVGHLVPKYTKHAWFKRWLKTRSIRRNLAAARAIFCPSEVVSRNILATFVYPVRYKREIIHRGVHPAFRTHTPAEISITRRAYLIPRSYAIMLGDSSETLSVPLRALGQSEDVSAITCVIVGPSHLPDELRETIRDCHLEGLVRFIDDNKITMQDLSTLYSGAQVTFEPAWKGDYRPSILQSMACGTPVICAASDDNEELYGNAVHVVHPTNTTEWLRAFESITLSSLLRERLIERGNKCIMDKLWSTTWREIFASLKRGAPLT